MIHVDVFTIIFQYIPLVDRATCMRVCKEWYTIIPYWKYWTPDELIECVKHDNMYFVKHNRPTFRTHHFEMIMAAIKYKRFGILKYILSDTTEPIYKSFEICNAVHWLTDAEIYRLLLANPTFEPCALPDTTAFHNINYFTHSIASLKFYDIYEELLDDPRFKYNKYNQCSEYRDIGENAPEKLFKKLVHFITKQQDANLDSILDDAIGRGFLDTCQHLIENGYAHVSEYTIRYAVRAGQIEIVKYLLRYTTPASYPDHIFTAATCGRHDIVKMFYGLMQKK